MRKIPVSFKITPDNLHDGTYACLNVIENEEWQPFGVNLYNASRFLHKYKDDLEIITRELSSMGYIIHASCTGDYITIDKKNDTRECYISIFYPNDKDIYKTKFLKDLSRLCDEGYELCCYHYIDYEKTVDYPIIGHFAYFCK